MSSKTFIFFNVNKKKLSTIYIRQKLFQKGFFTVNVCCYVGKLLLDRVLRSPQLPDTKRTWLHFCMPFLFSWCWLKALTSSFCHLLHQIADLPSRLPLHQRSCLPPLAPFSSRFCKSSPLCSMPPPVPSFKLLVSFIRPLPHRHASKIPFFSQAGSCIQLLNQKSFSLQNWFAWNLLFIFSAPISQSAFGL